MAPNLLPQCKFQPSRHIKIHPLCRRKKSRSGTVSLITLLLDQDDLLLVHQCVVVQQTTARIAQTMGPTQMALMILQQETFQPDRHQD